MSEDLNTMMARLSGMVEGLRTTGKSTAVEEVQAQAVPEPAAEVPDQVQAAVIEEPASNLGQATIDMAPADMAQADEVPAQAAQEPATENPAGDSDDFSNVRQELARQARENAKGLRTGVVEEADTPTEKMSEARAEMLAMKNTEPSSKTVELAEPATEVEADSEEFNEQDWIKKAQERFAGYTYMNEVLPDVADEEPLPEDIKPEELDAVLVAQKEVLDETGATQERILLNFRKLEEVVAKLGEDTKRLDKLNDEDAVEVKILETHKIDNTEQKSLFSWLAKRRAKAQARKEEKKSKWAELVNRGKAAGKKDYEDSLLGKVESRLDKDQQKTADRLKKRGVFLKRDAALLFGGIATTLAAPIALIAGPIASVLGLGSATINTAASARAGLDALGTSLMKKAIEGSLGAGGVVRSVTSEVVASGAKAALGTPEVKKMLAEQGYTQSADIAELRAQMDQMMQMMQTMMAAQNKE